MALTVGGSRIDLSFVDVAALAAAKIPNNRSCKTQDGVNYTTSSVDEGSGVLLASLNYANPKAAQTDPQTVINTANIATNTANIATNTANIATNTGDIATNTGDIATNTGDIATNTANIATNTSDIATNTSAISALQADNPNDQTGTSYTVDITDKNKTIWMNNAAANVVTIPLSILAKDDVVMVMQEGDGETTITAVAGVLLNGIDGGSVAISAKYSGATIVKRASNSFVITGNIGDVA